MTIIADFDNKKFMDYAISEASKFLPEDMNEEKIAYVMENFKGSASRIAGYLTTDDSLNIKNYNEFISRAYFILEWIFKILVALVDSDIPEECRRGFVLDIGYTAYDISINIINLEDITEEQIKSTIEFQVLKKVKELLDNLEKEGLITEEIAKDFWKHPKMDKSIKNILFSLFKQ